MNRQEFLDDVAVKVLLAIFAMPAEARRDIVEEAIRRGVSPPEGFAENAFKVADAMLVERDKRSAFTRPPQQQLSNWPSDLAGRLFTYCTLLEGHDGPCRAVEVPPESNMQAMCRRNISASQEFR